MLTLCEGEVRFGEKILVKGHVVVKALYRRDGSHRKSLAAIPERQTVCKEKSPVITRIVIIYLAGFDILIRIAALIEQ